MIRSLNGEMKVSLLGLFDLDVLEWDEHAGSILQALLNLGVQDRVLDADVDEAATTGRVAFELVLADLVRAAAHLAVVNDGEVGSIQAGFLGHAVLEFIHAVRVLDV